jgi:hypothetical protein
MSENNQFAVRTHEHFLLVVPLSGSGVFNCKLSASMAMQRLGADPSSVSACG